MSCKEMSHLESLLAVVEHLPEFLLNHLFSLIEFHSHFRLQVAQTTF